MLIIKRTFMQLDGHHLAICVHHHSSHISISERTLKTKSVTELPTEMFHSTANTDSAIIHIILLCCSFAYSIPFVYIRQICLKEAGNLADC